MWDLPLSDAPLAGPAVALDHLPDLAALLPDAPPQGEGIVYDDGDQGWLVRNVGLGHMFIRITSWLDAQLARGAMSSDWAALTGIHRDGWAFLVDQDRRISRVSVADGLRAWFGGRAFRPFLAH